MRLLEASMNGHFSGILLTTFQEAFDLCRLLCCLKGGLCHVSEL